MFQTINLILYIAIIVAVILLAGLIYSKVKHSKRHSGLRIADTPAVVVSIRQIAELVTFCLFEEKILTERKASNIVDNKIGNFIASKMHKEDGLISDEICIIAKGWVRAGYRLDKMTDKDIAIKGDVLHVKLPCAEILDVIVNPKGWDFYVENGDWKEEQIKAIKLRAKQQIEEDAIAFGILQKAAEVGEKKLKALLLGLSLGNYKDVVFINQ